MMTTSSSQSSSSRSVTSKRAIKRKLDDSILKKARAALGLPLESKDDDDGDKQSDEPSLKWRKPRHNTAEGQIYIKNKEKRKLLEQEQTSIVQSSSSKTVKTDDKKKSKKKRKNKKKRKTTESDTATREKMSKNPESEKRHEMEAISYLQLWATNRDHWKFEKRKQTWLLQNCLNEKLIDDKRFEILLEYIASVKGAARQATHDEMQSVVKRKEMSGSDGNSNVKLSLRNESNQFDSTVSDVMYERARQIIQMLVD